MEGLLGCRRHWGAGACYMTGLLALWGEGCDTPIEAQFAEFYRTRLRRAQGQRVGATDLRAAYLRWSLQAQAETISFKTLRRLMQRNGHRHFYSNQAKFADVMILQDHEAIAHVAGVRRDERASIGALVDRVDQAMSELAALRQALVEAAK